MRLANLPSLVRILCANHDAWIMGGAATVLLESNGGRDREKLDSVRDWDVHVPFHSWQAASHLIPKVAFPNRFGGWKITEQDTVIDIWPGDLGQIVSGFQEAVHCIHPSSGTWFVTQLASWPPNKS